MEKNSTGKVLIIGLDGATFTLLKPWMDQGYLPAIKSLVENGASGTLRTVVPPITGPAWSSFMTGVNPGRHRIYDFLIRDEDTGKDIPINARLRRGKAFWEYLSEAGKRVVVLNVPVTYPPVPVNGVMISDFLTPAGKRDFIYPVELVDEIEQKFGKYPLYFRMPIFCPNLSDANTTAFLKEIREGMEYKFNVACYLHERYQSDLLMLHIWGTDRIQHELWNFFDESHIQFKPDKKNKFYGEIIDYYKRVDRNIARLIDLVGKDSTVFIVSDHGFGPTHWMIDLNTWLLENGFIKIKNRFLSKLKYFLWKKGFTSELMLRVFVKKLFFKYLWRFYNTNPERFIRTLSSRSIGFLLGVHDIDWQRTTAFATYSSSIYINKKGVFPEGCVESEEQAQDVCRRIVEALRNLRNPATGELVGGDIVLREEAFHGPYAQYCPDITYLPQENKYLAYSFMGFGSNKVIFEAAALPGNHTMNGVLVAQGPSIRKGTKVAGAHLMDIAPTVLYLMGQKIPRDMEGKVLTEIIREEFVAAHPIEYRETGETRETADILTEEDQKDVIEKLKGLGYL